MQLIRHKKNFCLYFFFALVRLLYFFSIIFIQGKSWSLPLEGFDLPLKSIGDVSFYVDICQFEGEKEKNVTEIYYSLDLFQFSSTNSPRAVFMLNLQLITAQGESVATIHERKEISLANVSDNESAYSFVDLKRFELLPDTLTLYLNIQDSVSGKEGSVKESFVVSEFPEQLSISDLFFASHIQKAVEKSNFEKHGLVLVPNPSRVFSASAQTPNAYVYFEINSLSFHPDKPSSYSISYVVEDLSGKEVASHTRPTILKTSANCARVEIIPLSDFKAGLYRLKMKVTDLYNGESCSAWRYFRIHTGEKTDELVLPMTEADIKKYYDQIKYIATHEEKKLFEKLSLRGKQEFLLNFWKSRDSDPQTPENEFMQEHFRRLAYCESTFAGGINSDMGRIYIQYGPPLDIQRQFSTAEFSKPIETWIYAIDGRTEFVFVDRSGDGHYVLVHSTHKDEYHNPNWMNEIK